MTIDFSKAELSALSLTPEKEQRLNSLSGTLCSSCQKEITVGELECIGYCFSCWENPSDNVS